RESGDRQAQRRRDARPAQEHIPLGHRVPRDHPVAAGPAVVGEGPGLGGHMTSSGGPSPETGRSSRILGSAGGRVEGRRAVLIAMVSTVVFFTVIVVAVLNSPGWLEVKRAFFSGERFREDLPGITRAFWINVKLFPTAEVLILVLALFIAVLRSLPGPVFFPIRALAVGYTDLFRGVPTILVIYILGFG